MAAWRADRLDDAAAFAGQWEAVTTGSPEARSRLSAYGPVSNSTLAGHWGNCNTSKRLVRLWSPLGETEELAWVYSQLAEAHMLVEDMDAAQEWADRSLDTGRSSPVRRGQGAGLGEQGIGRDRWQSH